LRKHSPGGQILLLQRHTLGAYQKVVGTLY
jgi:hypothetical protein